eukprot:3510569-Amphidinium_carterae.1
MLVRMLVQMVVPLPLESIQAQRNLCGSAPGLRFVRGLCHAHDRGSVCEAQRASNTAIETTDIF